MAQTQALPSVARDQRGGRVQLAAAVIGGHALKHLYLSGMQSILLPEIKIAFDLSGTQIGALAGVRQVSGWATTMGSGYLGDRFSSKTALLLTISLSLMGIAYFLAGISTSYALLFGALFLAGIGPSMYHPPAISALSRRFPDKRAFAISLHGTGGSVGEVLGPVTVSALVVLLSWQGVLQLSLLPALIGAFLIWRLMGNMNFEDGGAGSFREYLQSLARLLRNKALALLVVVTALRTMGQSSIVIFLPVYLREDLDYSTGTVGVLLSLAFVVGIGSQPVMGYLSDRLGYKRVLTPALVGLGSLLVALALVEGTVQLTLVIMAMGAFLFSMHSIFISAAIHAVGEEAQATTVSLMYAASIMGTLSPVLAGAIADSFGTETVFLYAATVVFVATFIFAVMKLPAANQPHAA